MFFIVSSGALVLREIYESVGDLDLTVAFKGLEQLKNNYSLVQKENGWYTVIDKIECVCIGNIEVLKYKPEQSESGYFVQNIFEYFEFLKSSSREKDIARIPLVKDYIETLNNR